MNHTIKLGQHGRMIIPAEVRHTLGLKEGDELLLSTGDKRIVLETQEAILERLYTAVGQPPESELVSEELLRERREEATLEDSGQ